MHSPETHRVLRKAAASLQEILTNPASSLIIFFSFKKLFPLVPQLPPGDPTVLWKIQAGNQAWECWVQVAVFPSLKLFSGGGFCLFFFFFFHLKGESRLQREAFSIGQYPLFLLLSFSLPLSSLPSSQIRSLSMQPSGIQRGLLTRPRESFHPNLAQPDSKEILRLSLQLSRSLSLDPFMPSR